MGEIKSKASQIFNSREAWRLKERQENVNKFIRRINMKAEEALTIFGDVEKDSKRKTNFRKKSKKKRVGNQEKNNNNLDVLLEQVLLRNSEPECCETTEEMRPREQDDVSNSNFIMQKEDSIDNIIDMIVSKSKKRDETLVKIAENGNTKKVLKRSRSYHGTETKTINPIMESLSNIQKPEVTLIKRLENLEKRALLFERGMGKLDEWDTKSRCRRQRSRCSAASEEFEKNMIGVLEENYKGDESLCELKTIERVKPFEKIVEKDKLIAAPKADPIIRNSIKKIVSRVTKIQKVVSNWNDVVINGYRKQNYTSNSKGSEEGLCENGQMFVDSMVDGGSKVETAPKDSLKNEVIAESTVPRECGNGVSYNDNNVSKMTNGAPKIGNGVVKTGNGIVKVVNDLVSDENFKSKECLVGSKIVYNSTSEVKSNGKSKDIPRISGGKTYCQTCKKKCSGEVLRVQDKYFHISCFKCKACKNSLAQGGFFCKDGDYYCTNDYQRQFGTKCSHCGEYVEGEVVTALGNTYHQKCFTCGRCRQVFPSGERVTYTGKEVLCQKCVQIPVRDTMSPARSPTGPCECAGCGEELKDGQALIALERQWHIWCFKCKACDSVLHGEYMGKEGVPYCEKDYQKHFGVKCAYCSRFISGKVLQAGDNHHFHPTCARCSKCGDPFGDGEEMYLQGGAIWHPRCGPGPTENGTILNGSSMLENGHYTDTDGEMSGRDGRDFDRMSSSAVSEMQFSLRSRTPSLNGSLGSPCNSLSRKYAYHRTGSPGIILREYKSSQQFPEDISRIYTYSYLTEEPSQGYLKRPIDPYDKPPTSPHFHRPSSSHSLRSGKILIKTGSKSGMRVMAESIRSETPRPKSPHMNNEEPIELAHFPDAKKPKPGEKSKIERDDFPAPPYPYTDPERRKRWSDSHKGDSDGEEDEVDTKDKEMEDDKLKKEEEELSKIATGIGKVFLQNVKEREKLKKYKLQHLDPRNASRVPSANKEPAYRLRYQSPVNASPSRNMDHPRPWEEEEYMDRSSSYRSSVGRSIGAIPNYNATSSSRLGYARSPGKASTLPTGRYMSGYCSDYGVGYNGDFSYSGGFGEKTHSTEFSSGKSDISGGSISEVDRRVLNADMPMSTTFQGGLRYSSYSPHLRRSLPTLSHMSTEPPKIYPYHLLVITNYRLPADVDRCNLERHLSENEFEQRFQCSRAEFYRMPQWRRNDMKRRLKLF